MAEEQDIPGLHPKPHGQYPQNTFIKTQQNNPTADLDE